MTKNETAAQASIEHISLRTQTSWAHAPAQFAYEFSHPAKNQ
jgi:hypothetical protein